MGVHDADGKIAGQTGYHRLSRSTPTQIASRNSPNGGLRSSLDASPRLTTNQVRRFLMCAHRAATRTTATIAVERHNTHA